MAEHHKKKTKSVIKKNPTKAEESYLQYLLRGMKQIDAYRKAYPGRTHWKDSAISSAASTLLRKPHVESRYRTLLEEFQKKETEKTGWTREEAIKSLKFVVDKNIEEVNRINDAFDEELDYLLAQIQQHPERAEQIALEIIKKRKAKRMNVINNTGIISAASELNKMHGYNETNVSLNGVVVFEGEEELED